MVALGAPVVYFSTDYVFDGSKGEPYVESDVPIRSRRTGARSSTASARSRDGWIVRSSWLFGATGQQLRAHDARLGAERDEVAVVDDQRGSPTYVGHLAEATRIVELPHGLYHVAAEGDCTWAEFAEAIFEEAGSTAASGGSRPRSSGRPAPRPAYSVLRSEREAPQLPHWREGLRACLARLL